MKTSKQAERERVYTTYRHLFLNKTSLTTKAKDVRKRLLAQRSSTGQQLSTKEVDRLLPIIQSLIDTKVFSSTDIARKEFPAVFMQSSSQMKVHGASQVSAIKKDVPAKKELNASQVPTNKKMLDASHVSAIKMELNAPNPTPKVVEPVDDSRTVPAEPPVNPSVLRASAAIFDPKSPDLGVKASPEASASKRDSITPEVGGSHIEPDDKQESERAEAHVAGRPDVALDAACKLGNEESIRRERSREDSSHPPIYLPYATQHQLLSGIQEILEHCCFEFVSKWLPEETRTQRWDTPCAVELTKWTQLLPSWQQNLAPEAIATKAKESLGQTCLQVTQIRHSAVHRLPLDVKTLQNLLRAAVRLTTILRDEARSATLMQIVGNVEDGVRELEDETETIESSCKRESEAIAEQRRKLDAAERDLFNGAARDRADIKARIGSELRRSTRTILMDVNPTARDLPSGQNPSWNEATGQSQGRALTPALGLGPWWGRFGISI